MSVWFPVRTRGVYESIEYIDGEDLSPKEYVKNTEEECDELCDQLNSLTYNEIMKATKIINSVSKKYNLDISFIIPIMKEQLYSLEHRD